MTWLRSEFGTLSDDILDQDILYAVGAYMLDLVGKVIFIDNRYNKVHYKWLMYLEHISWRGAFSWESAVFSNLFSEMSKVALRVKKEITGCPILLKVCNFLILFNTFIHRLFANNITYANMVLGAPPIWMIGLLEVQN